MCSMVQQQQQHACRSLTVCCASAAMRCLTSGFAIIARSTSGRRMCGGRRASIICCMAGLASITSIMLLRLSTTASPLTLALEVLATLLLLLSWWAVWRGGRRARARV